MKDIYKILVPTDFSDVADTAIKTAAKIAKTLNGEIVLLHVVEKESEINASQSKLESVVKDVMEAESIPTVGKVVTGNIFEDIGKVAQYEGIKLIVMGTHGRKGMQHLTGSHAMKVITSSEIPFIVVQNKQVPVKYTNIVFPIDFKVETKIKIAITASMADQLGAKIHIFGEHNDDQFHDKQVENNITYAKKFFTDKNIDFTVSIAQEKGNFVKQILRYGSSINADMLAVLNLNYQSISHFLESREEELITNESQIPVLMVNPSNSFLEKSMLFGKFQTL